MTILLRRLQRLLVPLVAVWALAAAAPPSVIAGQKTVHVKGYTKKDGTVVKPYDRKAPGQSAPPATTWTPTPAPEVVKPSIAADPAAMQQAYAAKVTARTVAAGEPPPFVVLKVQSWKVGTEGTAVATLASGTTVTFASSDLDTTAIEALRNAQNAARTALGTVVIIPTPDASAATIGTICTAKWPANLSAQEVCRAQQKSAVSQLWSHDVLRTAAGRAIRNACKADWPEDFTMESYCEEQQMRAPDPR
ncbi:MAG: hypothetical protein ABI818_12070 [Acidobacteriota bacterium]